MGKTASGKTRRKPTLNQKRVLARVQEQVRKGEKVSVSKAMEGIYSPHVAKQPQRITNTPVWQEFLDTFLADADLATTHQQLLRSHHLDHMVFPLGPKADDHPFLSGGKPNSDNRDPDADPEAAMPEEHKERTSLTDDEIVEMLAAVNCTVRRIVHGETARHVYFWTPDNKARKEALDMAYKLKGRYPRENPNVAVQLTFGVVKHVYEQAAEEANRLKNGGA